MVKVMITNADSIHGYDIEFALGTVTGVATGDSLNPEGAKAVRVSALERMAEQAAQTGADAVVRLHYDSEDLVNSQIEYTARGTAVKLRHSNEAKRESQSANH